MTRWRRLLLVPPAPHPASPARLSAGGRAVDALRSVVISQQLLGTTEVSALAGADGGGGVGRVVGGADIVDDKHHCHRQVCSTTLPRTAADSALLLLFFPDIRHPPHGKCSGAPWMAASASQPASVPFPHHDAAQHTRLRAHARNPSHPAFPLPHPTRPPANNHRRTAAC